MGMVAWVALAVVAQQGGLNGLVDRQVDPATTGRLVQPAPPRDTTGTLRAAERVEPGPLPAPPRATAVAGAPLAVAPAGEDMDARVNEVRVCRFDVAAGRHVAPARVRVGEVELRWSVLPDGSVGAAEVVSLRPTDPDVMSCAKRKVEAWRFAPRAAATPPRFVERVDLRGKR